MEHQVAQIGNYEKLRNCYTTFRQLVRDKKISLSAIAQNEIEYIRSNITFNKSYNNEEAVFLYNFLYRFLNDFVINGIDFSKVPIPDAKLKKSIVAESVMKFVGFGGDKFIIRFPYDNDLYKKVKAIKDGIYNAEKRDWSFPIVRAEEIKNFAEENGFTIGENAMRIIYGVQENLEQSYSSERIELNIPLKKDLFDYQTVGVDFELRVRRALNADEMGLGKTPQAIAYTMGLNQWPVLIVCPKSLKYNWQNEFIGWTDRKVLVANKAIMNKFHRYIELGVCEVLIINYDGLKKYFCESVEEDGRGLKIKLNKNINYFKAIVLDEAHKQRNEKTQLYKITKKICHSVSDRLLLTGTPVVNKVNDLASMLDLLGYLDSEFGGRWKFNSKYAKIGRSHFENKNKKENNNHEEEHLLKELNIKLRSTCMIRREKHQVLKELPDKIRSTHDVELSNRAEYDHAFLNLQDFLANLGVSDEKISQAMRAEILVKFTYLKKLSAHGKINDFVEFAEELFENGEKVVLFTWHKEILNEVKKHFPDMIIINGDVKDEFIRDSVAAFQTNSKVRIIGLTYSRGAEGLTLTASHHWCCLELPWTDAILNQGEDRIHRYGQKDTAYCHYFLGRDTVDQHIYKIIERKRNLSKFATGSTGQIEETTANELLKILQTKPKPLIEKISA